MPKKIGIFEMARCCLCPSLQHLLCEHQQCVHSADCLRGRWGSSERDLFGCTSSGPTHVRHCHSATIHPHPSTGTTAGSILVLVSLSVCFALVAWEPAIRFAPLCRATAKPRPIDLRAPIWRLHNPPTARHSSSSEASVSEKRCIHPCTLGWIRAAFPGFHD